MALTTRTGFKAQTMAGWGGGRRKVGRPKGGGLPKETAPTANPFGVPDARAAVQQQPFMPPKTRRASKKG